jgi:hypothetical protein
VIAAVHVSNVTANNAGIHMGIRSGEQGYFPGALRSLEITVDEVQEEFDTVRKEVGNLMREWGI